MVPLHLRGSKFVLLMLCGMVILTFVYQPWNTIFSNFDLTSEGRHSYGVSNQAASLPTDTRHVTNQKPPLPTDGRPGANQKPPLPTDKRPGANQKPPLPTDKRPGANQTTSSTTDSQTAANDTTSLSDPRSPTKVLLVTKYRSGSSFLGEILNQNPDCIYWFEPLIAYSGRINEHNLTKPYGKHNPTLRSPGAESLLYKITKILGQCLDCDIAGLGKEVKFRSVLKRSPKIEEAVTCAKSTVGDKLGHCTDLLQYACLGSGIVAVKTIRFPLYQAQRLLSANSAVKLVYYARDPRGMLDSRRMIDNDPPELLVDLGVDICRGLRQDQVHLSALLADFPGRVLSMRYEDLAKDPTGTVRRLYAFLGEPVPEVVYDWIRTNTQQESSDRYGTTRVSRVTAEKWRVNLPHDVITRLTIACRDILDQLHYDF